MNIIGTESRCGVGLYLTEHIGQEEKRTLSACLTPRTESDASGCAETEDAASATSPKASQAARRVRVLRHLAMMEDTTEMRSN